ncbi:DUF3320 domain-containing protein [Geofilum rubicundum]|uniref:DNA helicase n=1 Tax=Geofilum rubicundum JCM 15548 TaxID=1236989 RepID=A0A0E9LYY9_9BACT|nr:DUF3320 domain-containing protein [Geofilum rubicundum]GAO30449.1 DNA helicase [Geofilum rubicundum JCM 15548]
METNIGSSGYKIDIAIVNPDNPSEYLLGILTDGLTYRAAKTAKDRELNQAGVLKMLGWNIYKLWSLDWWDNPQKVLEDIEKVIKQLPDPGTETTPASQLTASIKSPVATEQKREQYASIKLQDMQQPTTQQITQQILEPVSSAQPYRVCELTPTNLQNSDALFDYRLKEKITVQITQVLETEAPISHALLSKRILNAWGISRLGVRLNNYLTAKYNKMEIKYTQQNGTKFYWTNEQDPQKHSTYKNPAHRRLQTKCRRHCQRRNCLRHKGRPYQPNKSPRSRPHQRSCQSLWLYPLGRKCRTVDAHRYRSFPFQCRHHK